MKRIDDGDLIIKALKASYEKRTGKANKSITLPARVQFYKNQNKINIYLNKESVCKNMQEDEAAFDSWALSFKSWMEDIDNVSLEWEKPDNVDNGHYQRFLYRVQKLEELFNNWFVVEDNSRGLLNDLKLIAYKDAEFIINLPAKPRLEGEEPKGTEAYYEWLFSEEYKHLITLIAEIEEDKVYRQLPVGLFKDTVSRASAVFTGGKSAIDIWGISNEKKKLSIFELKAPDVNKIGALSELFFYTIFQEDMLAGKFKYEENTYNDYHEGVNELLELKKSDNISIDAFILANIVHPLIDETMLKFINNSFEQAKRIIKFGYICYTTTPLSTEKKF